MHTITYVGKILFEPPNKTKKHIAQASWKKVAMIMFDGDVAEYYRWFLNRRFNIELNEPQRGAHITFINDSIDDLNNRQGTINEKEAIWESLKQKWDGKEIEVTFNLRPFSNIYHWWLIVDHKHREEIHSIRAEAGLGRPYFGLHMTFGIQTENFNEKGEIMFNRHIEHSRYINHLNETGRVELNMDYRMESVIEIKRISPERVDLYNSADELIGTLFNEYELNHIRIQIASKKITGYYIIWKTQKIEIDDNGKLKEWPAGLYDIQEKQLAELFKTQNIK